VTPSSFNAALNEVAPQDRDAWLDQLWEIDEIPLDDPALPRGCVPYLPCPVASVLDALEQAEVTSKDVFVDVGAGLGRATLLAHLQTGASCIGLEVQPTLVRLAQNRADSLRLSRMRFLQGDAVEKVRFIADGTVFFLYCPFSGERLGRFLEGLEEVARAWPIRICCVDMPLLQAQWLARMPSKSPSVDVYRSR
jgi:SAM-dependent methyltransferase